MQVPKITKVVLNMGIGEGVADRKKVDNAASDLALIAGQKTVITKSRKSIATYKLRDGQAIGCKVTLRKARMLPRSHRLSIPGVIGQVNQQVSFLLSNKASRYLRNQVFVTNQRRDSLSAGQVQSMRAVAGGKPFHEWHARQ